MKKGAIAIILVLILILPLVLAEEENYSNLERFKDNVRMFFSFGDNKVRVALEIKEKEINSAIYNANQGNQEESEKNLDRAWDKLQFVDEKVSLETAEEVSTSSAETINQINAEENLPVEAGLYALEEEKTQLAAELVIVENGEEDQTETLEIEGSIGEVNDDIKEWVVENTIDEGESNFVQEVKIDIAAGKYDIAPGSNTVDSGDNYVDSGSDGSDSNPGGDDLGPVDDGPGEPGVVDD